MQVNSEFPQEISSTKHISVQIVIHIECKIELCCTELEGNHCNASASQISSVARIQLKVGDREEVLSFYLQLLVLSSAVFNDICSLKTFDFFQKLSFQTAHRGTRI